MFIVEEVKIWSILEIWYCVSQTLEESSLSGEKNGAGNGSDNVVLLVQTGFKHSTLERFKFYIKLL